MAAPVPLVPLVPSMSHHRTARLTGQGVAVAAAVAVNVRKLAMAAGNCLRDMTKSSDITMMDAVSLSRAIHSRQVSCAEVMKATLDHIEVINPKVNAIVSLQDR